MRGWGQSGMSFMLEQCFRVVPSSSLAAIIVSCSEVCCIQGMGTPVLRLSHPLPVPFA